MMIAGSVTTGVDPVSGDLMAMDMMDEQAAEMMGIETVCLVTDLGRVNDGTFNQSAHEGAVKRPPTNTTWSMISSRRKPRPTTKPISRPALTRATKPSSPSAS